MIMEMNLGQLSELSVGMSLPGLKKSLTQEQVNLYAEASQDFNPIHIDEDFARKTPLGGTIAHGMLILAYVSQMMTTAFGRDWLVGGMLNVRFKEPARPGDTITVSGRISGLEKNSQETVINCDVQCGNQKNEVIITGEAKLSVKNNKNSY